MNSDIQVVLFWVVIGLLVVLLVGLTIRMAILNSSFTKLGFFVREDAKKYFSETADDIQKVNAQLQQTNQEAIQKGVAAALMQAEQLLEPVVKQAHEEASEILLESRVQAKNIIEAGKADANANAKRVVDKSSEAIRWVMQQYAGEILTDDKHEEIVKKLLSEYINESRK
ncbi:hypothetical protein EOL73_02780 [Candidatus Saccharibacteria bacterium]|nr:hypothetical protein [Candidatus Saccharibacteria bacterium]